MHTDYLEQPTLSQSSFSFDVAPGSSGANSVDASSITVTYVFKDVSDSLGNRPPVVAPDPINSWSSIHLIKEVESLGTNHLFSPEGVLTSTTGNKIQAGETLSMPCPWAVDKQD